MNINRKKIIWAVAILLAGVAAVGIYVWSQAIFEKSGIVNVPVATEPLPQPSEKSQQCESEFVFSPDMVTWAMDNKSIGDLNQVVYCQAGLSGDYKDCDLLDSKGDSAPETHTVENEKKICQKIVFYKKVFMGILGNNNVSDQNVSDFESYISKYEPANSHISDIFASGKVKPVDFLEGFLNGDVGVCDGIVDQKESCQAFIARDEKYCDNLSDNKEGCITGARLMNSLKSGDIQNCDTIQGEGNIVSLVCKSILNEEKDFCTQPDFLYSFIKKYCLAKFPN